MKIKKKPKTTLSDKIAEVLTVKQHDDIEDDHEFRTKPKTVSRVDFSSSDSEDEATISDFRKRNVNLLSDLSKKYEGEVVSRKHIESDSLEDSDNENLHVAPNQPPSDASDESNDSLKDISQSDNDDSDDAESDDYSITKSHAKESSDGDNSESDGEEGYDVSQLEEPMKETFEHMKKEVLSEEVKKGNAVRNQLLLWESLLEMRIHLQRCINTANQMPMSDTYVDLKNASNAEFIAESNSCKANISTVLNKVLNLQGLLLRNNPETKSVSSSKQGPEKKLEPKDESDEEIPSDTEDEEIPSDTDNEESLVSETKVKKVQKVRSKKRKHEDYENEIDRTHKALKTFRDATIQKWNEKTRVASAANLKNAPTNTVLQQISYILSDRDKLIKRTQLKRSEYDIVGYKKPSPPVDVEDGDNVVNFGSRDKKDDDEYIPEIFDDSDFYHQLLRELIECKSADISDPVQLSRQWIALQQMRSKMKRKVDTKATKGRRIKYVVHNKLVNYMAPEKNTKWSDESKNELYSSLFGKLFENNSGVGVNLGNGFKIIK